MDEDGWSLFPQILPRLIEVDDLPLRTIGHLLAQSQVFKASNAKRNACI